MRIARDLAAAFQFFTRLPIPGHHFSGDSVAQSARFFPLVGLVVGLGASALHRVLTGNIASGPLAALILTYLVLVTGGFHEDGLADAADGFGGGWTRERILEIMRDSRIGSFGALALFLSLLLRYSLLSSLSTRNFSAYVIAAHVLCRWTTLPLSFFLKPARRDGQGVNVAQRISAVSCVIGTVLTLTICFFLLRRAFWTPLAATAGVTLLTALYYRGQIGGVTGDCFGATNQAAEIAVYFCGVLAS